MKLQQLFSVISCEDFLIRFSLEGQYKPRNVRPIIFASLRSHVRSILCSKDFWLHRGNISGWGERCRYWGQLPPGNYAKTALISRNVQGT